VDCRDCGHRNPAGARFCNECGVGLGVDKPAPEIDRHPISYTPRHLAERILKLRASLEGERKFVTVLFADVVGSMTIAEQLGPEPWHRVLDRYFRILAESIHGLGGVINQFTGDGVMALFGAPIALEDHAQRACHAAFAIFESLEPLEASLRRDFDVSFATRIGLNSGEVVVGKIGDDLRMDYTAQGHAVGLAARVERLAKPGSCCVTGHTAELVEGYFDFSNLGDHSLAGSQNPVAVFELTGLGKLRTRLDRSGADGFSPLVGREPGLASLERALDEGGLVVGIEGPAGIGKSRLAYEFVERSRSRGIDVCQAHCSSIGQSVPWLPIQELLGDYFGVPGGSEDLGAANRIAGDPVFQIPECAGSLATVLELFGLDSVANEVEVVPPRSRAAKSPADRRAEIADVLVQLVRARSQDSPCVVLIDDLHWIDEDSSVVLTALVEAVSSTRALLLLNFRPEFRADWMRASHYRQIGLTPLGVDTGRELLDALLGGNPSLHELRDRVLQDTGGNPLFIEELVRALVETGKLEGPRGAHRLTDSSPVEIPATLQPILAARIDRLTDTDKGTLQIASVIGRQFERTIVEFVSEDPTDVVVQSLERLEHAQFIRCVRLHPNTSWVFHHPLIREVAYNALLQERRENLHAEVASGIEASGEALGQRASLIAYHWESANQPAQARRWKMRATLRVTHIQPRRHH
jgi:class 3 adenylate cyclase